MPKTAAKSEKLDLRLTPEMKRVLQSAASARHRSVSQFVLESAMDKAEETLPDRQVFGLDIEQWTAFQEALDAPPRPMPRLAELLAKPSVFERSKLK